MFVVKILLTFLSGICFALLLRLPWAEQFD